MWFCLYFMCNIGQNISKTSMVTHNLFCMVETNVLQGIFMQIFKKLTSLFAPALPELLWLPTAWRCPYIEIAFSTLDCSIVPTCGAWCSATAAKRGPLKQSWAGIQHSRDGEPLGVLMQMRNVRVNGFFFFSSLGVLPDVLVDTISLCGGNFCVECVLIVLHKFYIELYKKYNWLDPGPSMRFDEIIILFCNKCR